MPVLVDNSFGLNSEKSDILAPVCLCVYSARFGLLRLSRSDSNIKGGE